MYCGSHSTSKTIPNWQNFKLQDSVLGQLVITMKETKEEGKQNTPDEKLTETENYWTHANTWHTWTKGKIY